MKKCLTLLVDICGVVKTTWLDEAHVRAYSDDHVQSLTKHPMDYVANVLKELKLDKKTIAVEMDNYWFSARAYTKLVQNLPDAKIVDGDLLVNWIRIIKSPAEIALQRKAGKLAEIAMQTAVNNLHAGVRQCDVVAEIYSAHLKGTKEFGGDYPAIVPLMPSGETAGAPHLTWTDKKYKYCSSSRIDRLLYEISLSYGKNNMYRKTKTNCNRYGRDCSRRHQCCIGTD